MKEIYRLIYFIVCVIIFNACAINDPVDDWARIGQRVPHVYWELASTKIASGDSLEFKGQYYTNEGREVDRMEVWYDIKENTLLEATCSMVSFNYSLSIDETKPAREEQSIITYKHSESYWDNLRKAYVFDGRFPVSNTLRPVEWKEVADFDNNRYNTLFPDSFARVFRGELFEKLEDVDNLSDYRLVLVNTERLTVEEFNECVDSLFSDLSGSWEKFIKEKKKDFLKSEYDAIPFEDLIYNSSESKYMINYQKYYTIDATFRVYDEDDNQGVSEKFTIEII